MMENISILCDKDLEIDGEKFSRLSYGNPESSDNSSCRLKALKISLVQKSDPEDLLKAFYKKLIENSELSEPELLRVFNNKKSSLTLEDLPEAQRDELEKLYKEPEGIDDVANFMKSLSLGEINKVLEWFGNKFRDSTGEYPAFYIDEFEFMVRNNPDGKVRDIVEFTIRKATEYNNEPETADSPPYILFANTTLYKELRDKLGVERDLISRLSDSINFNLDLSPEETKMLFKKLFRLYSVPILENNRGNEEVEEWLEELNSSKSGAYPFTEEALQYIVSITPKHSTLEGSEDEQLIRAFRVYKGILKEFLSLWGGEGEIDKEFLYRHGDTVREELGSNALIADTNTLPGKEQVNDVIDEGYGSHEKSNKVVMDLLKALAKDSILSQDKPVYSKEEIREIASSEGYDSLESSELNSLYEVAISNSLFSREGERLQVKKQELFEEIDEGEIKNHKELLESVVDENSLIKTSLKALWANYLTDALSRTNIGVTEREEYIEINALGEYRYADKIFLSFDKEPESVKLQETDALSFSITLEDSSIEFNDKEGDDFFIDYQVREVKDRVDSVCESIENVLSSKINDEIDDESKVASLEKIARWFDKTEYEAVKLLLKISLLDSQGKDLPDFLESWCFPSTAFRIPQMVEENLRRNNPYSYVLSELGFKETKYRNRKSNQLMDLAYAIKKMERDGQENLIYDRPNDPEVEISEFGKASTEGRSSKEFEELLERKLSNEEFVEENDISTAFGPKMDSVMKEIQVFASDEPRTMDDISEKLFGTTEIANNAKAAIYLVLVLGEYKEMWDIDEKDRNSSLKISPYEDDSVDPDEARKKLKREISWGLVESLSREDELDEELDQKLDNYRNASGMDEDVLENIVDRELEDQIDVDKEQNKLKGVRSSKELPEYVVNYLNELIPALSGDKYQVRLIQPRVKDLRENLESAEKVLDRRAQVEEFRDKLEEICGKEKAVGLEKDEISVFNEVKTHYLENNPSEALENSAVKEVIDEFFEDPGSIDLIKNRLKELRDEIIPQTEIYDNSDHLSRLRESEEAIKKEIEEQVSKKRKQVRKEREKVRNEFEPKVVKDEENWLERGNQVLDKCEDALSDDPEKLDVDKFLNNWRRWEEEIKPEIEEGLMPKGEKIEEEIGKYQEDFEPKDIVEAANIRIDQEIGEMPEEETDQLIDKLQDLESEESKNLLKYLINRRVLKEDQ